MTEMDLSHFALCSGKQKRGMEIQGDRPFEPRYLTWVEGKIKWFKWNNRPPLDVTNWKVWFDFNDGRGQQLLYLRDVFPLAFPNE